MELFYLVVVEYFIDLAVLRSLSAQGHYSILYFVTSKHIKCVVIQGDNTTEQFLITHRYFYSKYANVNKYERGIATSYGRIRDITHACKSLRNDIQSNANNYRRELVNQMPPIVCESMQELCSHPYFDYYLCDGVLPSTSVHIEKADAAYFNCGTEKTPFRKYDSAYYGMESKIRLPISVLPNDIGNYTNLAQLSLTGNRLTGLPDGISKLQNLFYLDLQNNDFQECPRVLSSLSRLSSLRLDQNNIHRSMRNLRNLNINTLGINLTSVGSELRFMSRLWTLHLGRMERDYVMTTYIPVEIYDTKITEIQFKQSTKIINPKKPPREIIVRRALKRWLCGLKILAAMRRWNERST